MSQPSRITSNTSSHPPLKRTWLTRLVCCGCCTQENAEDLQQQQPKKVQRREISERKVVPRHDEEDEADTNSTSSNASNPSVTIDIDQNMRQNGNTRNNEVEMHLLNHPSSAAATSSSSSSNMYNLPSSLLPRALTLASWDSLLLGWRVLRDPNPASATATNERRRFYFNVWTAETTFTPPDAVREMRTEANQTSDLTIPGSIAWIPDTVAFFAELGIQLILWSDTFSQQTSSSSSSRHRQQSRSSLPAEIFSTHNIRGRTPCLWHLLFYSHVLRNEFSIYPRSFLTTLGLKRIVLIDHLHYGSQPRHAIPIVETSTLLLDPKLEEVMYVVNVLHHELFHMVDCNMIWRAGNARREDGRMLAMNQQQKNHRSTRDETPVFDFTFPLDPLEQSQPLASYALDSASILHGVTDHGWSRLNSNPHFSYGRGGAHERGNHMFLSLGRADESTTSPSTSPQNGMNGFLNAYSQTAVEEDKAEIYAAMMRGANSTIYTTNDSVLISKMNEMKRRLQWYCADMNEAFWKRVRMHTVHPARPAPDAGASAWIEKTDHAGNRYYFNRQTQQTSWVEPNTSPSPDIAAAAEGTLMDAPS